MKDDSADWMAQFKATAPQTTPGNPEPKRDGGETDEGEGAEAAAAAPEGLGLAGRAVIEGEQGLGTCSPGRLYRARLYLARFLDWVSPRWPELPEEIHQSIDEQTRVRSEWIRERRQQ